MAIIVFILGRPGCGKSAALRNIARLAQHKGLQPDFIIDYRILYDMFQKERYSLDEGQKKFRPSEHNGFDVVDFSVLDDVLRDVEKRARKLIEEYPSSKQKLVLIEFARDDYREALGLFSKAFLQDAYFLFIHADVDTCIERVRARTAHPDTDDDIFVSDSIMRTYYGRDITPDIICQVESMYNLNDQRVGIIDSNGTWDKFLYDVREFSHLLFDRPATNCRKTEPLAKSFSPNEKPVNRNLVEVV